MKLLNKILKTLPERTNDCFTDYSTRRNWVRQYSWAIPCKEAIKAIHNAAGERPIVELGAGGGLWGALLSEAGSQVHCYDIAPRGANNAYRHEKVWYNVRKGSTKVLVLPKYRDAVLFLCWPPYDKTLAYDALRTFQGDTFVYIGEGRGGCTGNDEFFDLLAAEWDEVERVYIPRWFGIHDVLYIYSRKLK